MIKDHRRTADAASTPLDIDGGTADVEDLLAPTVPEIDLDSHHAGGASAQLSPATPPATVTGVVAPAADLAPPDPSATDLTPVPPAHRGTITPPAPAAPSVPGDQLTEAADTIAALRPATPGIIRAALSKACHGSHRPLLKLLGLAGIGISEYHGPKSDEYPLRVWRPALAVATHRPHEPDPARAAEDCLSQVFPDGDADLLLIGLGDTDGVALSLAHRRAKSTTVVTTAVAADPTPADLSLLGALQAPNHPQVDQTLGDAWWTALTAHTTGTTSEQPADTDHGRLPPPTSPGPVPVTDPQDHTATHPHTTNPSAAALLAEATRIPPGTATDVILGLVDRLITLAEDNGRLRAKLEAAEGRTTCDT